MTGGSGPGGGGGKFTHALLLLGSQDARFVAVTRDQVENAADVLASPGAEHRVAKQLDADAVDAIHHTEPHCTLNTMVLLWVGGHGEGPESGLEDDEAAQCLLVVPGVGVSVCSALLIDKQMVVSMSSPGKRIIRL